MWDPLAEFAKKTLKNGLDVYSSYWPNRSWEKVFVIVHAGALQDNFGQEGTAHLLEHLISYNGDVNGKEDNYSFFNGQGGKFSLTTSPFATYFSFFGPAENSSLAEGLARVAKFVFNFTPNEELLKKERLIVEREFWKRHAMRFIYDNLVRERKVFFSGTPLETLIQSIGGSPETIKDISASALVDFHRRYYVPANISILAVGGMSQEGVFKIIEDGMFSANLSGERVALPPPLSVLPPLPENRFNFSLGEYVKASAGLNIGRLRICASVPGVINREAMLMFNCLVDEIIDQEIRQKNHWSYGADREWVNYRALHCISLQFSDLSPDRLGGAERVILNALSSLPKAKNLLEEQKRRRINHLKLLDYSGEELADDAKADLIDNHSIVTSAQRIELLEAVSIDDIQLIASHLGASRRWTLVQKP